MTDQRRFDLADRATYQRFTPVTIRFCDTDALGHVNNVSISSFIEAARCELFYDIMQKGGVGDKIDFVLARIAIDFKKEFFYPGTVEVGARFTRLGNRSITSGYGVFIGETCHATAESINVFFDLETRSSIAPPQSLQNLLHEAVR
jgi:acyl-CoA thioester hydrolase